MTGSTKCLCVISECYIDTNLADTLLGTAGVSHQRGLNNVCAVMQKNFADQFVVGIIDDDKRKPSYVSEFDDVGTTGHMTLKKHKDKPHYLIVISKAVEDFIFSCADEQKVDLKQYGLPNDMQELKVVTKTAKSTKDSRFKRLFNDLASSSKEMSVMKAILTYLACEKYQSDSAHLKELLS